MLEALIGSKTRERVLFYLVSRKEGYAREIAEFYQSSLSPVQIQLDRLESGNILVSRLSGKTRVYSFNPRYPFLQELLSLLNKAVSFLPDKEQQSLFMVRKRPRRKGKPL
jgi:predicted transcriptional regulator